jgi:predicted dehydrogenase/threonine dehydrogenase-like Zn-dependent dehydrogenase
MVSFMVRQIGQSYKTGRLSLEEVGYPPLKPGGLVIRTAFSVISIGTEGMKIREARMNLLEKARARPDQLKQVLDSVRRQGVRATYRKVMSRLDRLTPLGYSLSGYVVEAGEQTSGFHVGQRVAAAGADIANHGEYNLVPCNLAVPVPDGVPMDHAAFGTIGAIAMHALRQSKVTLGEVALVVGLGLIGQTLVRLLCAAGVRAIGIDPVAKRCALAVAGGAVAAGTPDDSSWRNTAGRISDRKGADAVLITAGTSDNAVIELAAEAVRERGRIVVVGKTKLELDYNTFFRKEIEVGFSRSYGPGRYDPAYEIDGIDYPYPYVRWTERRNIESFIDLLAARRIDLSPLVEIVRDFDQAAAIYDEIDSGQTRAIGVLLDYGVRGPGEARPSRTIAAGSGASAPATIGVLGAGNYAASMLLPPLKADSRVAFRTIVTTTGLTAANAARRFGASAHGTDRAAVLRDASIEGVVVATRHSSHAVLTAEALRAGKAVFVEKPLAIDAEGLAAIDAAVDETGNFRLMVGFNRRFAPIVRDLASAVAGKGPFVLLYRVQAGALPRDAWQLSETEGGRYIGEAGHFFDVFQLLTGSRAVSVSAGSLSPAHTTPDDRDNIAAVVNYADGSIATLVYATQGASEIGKEYLEVHGAGTSAVMDNFAELALYGPGDRIRKSARYGGDKGQTAQMRAFVDMIANGTPPPTPYDLLAETTRLTWLAADAARTRETKLMI